MIRKCKIHGEVKFWRSGPSWKCSICGQDRVREYRRKQKAEYVKRLGGACVNCGYDAHQAALCFHHKDPSLKDLKLKRTGGKTITYFAKDVFEKEFKNLELLCHNCHAVHHWVLDKEAQV